MPRGHSSIALLITVTIGFLGNSYGADINEALIKAEKLGHFLEKTNEDMSQLLLSQGAGHIADSCDTLKQFYANETLISEVSSEWLAIDKILLLNRVACNGVGAKSPDDRPALMIYPGNGHFFYEHTIIDMHTGFLYQSCGAISAGCALGAPNVRWFGPLQPSAEMSITGLFDLNERELLEQAIGRPSRVLNSQVAVKK